MAEWIKNHLADRGWAQEQEWWMALYVPCITMDTSGVDLAEFTKVTVHYNIIYWCHHSSFLFTCSIPSIHGYKDHTQHFFTFGQKCSSLFLCNFFILMVRYCHFWLSCSFCTNYHVHCPISRINRSFVRLGYFPYIIYLIKQVKNLS